MISKDQRRVGEQFSSWCTSAEVCQLDTVALDTGTTDTQVKVLISLSLSFPRGSCHGGGGRGSVWITGSVLADVGVGERCLGLTTGGEDVHDTAQ